MTDRVCLTHKSPALFHSSGKVLRGFVVSAVSRGCPRARPYVTMLVRMGGNVMAFLKNILHPLKAQDTTHLTDGEIRLLLRQFEWGSDYVGGLPCYFFKIVAADEMRKELGHCDLRVGTHAEIAYSGNIGYRVYRQHRGNHYALKASKLLLHFACELGMREAIITCNPDNEASRRTLEALGGRLLATVDVPPSSACYKAGDRRKCQFYFETGDYFQPALHNALVAPMLVDGEFVRY